MDSAAEWQPKMAEKCWPRAEQKVEPNSLSLTNFEIFSSTRTKAGTCIHILAFLFF